MTEKLNNMAERNKKAEPNENQRKTAAQDKTECHGKTNKHSCKIIASYLIFELHKQLDIHHPKCTSVDLPISLSTTKKYILHTNSIFCIYI